MRSNGAIKYNSTPPDPPVLSDGIFKVLSLLEPELSELLGVCDVLPWHHRHVLEAPFLQKSVATTKRTVVSTLWHSEVARECMEESRHDRNADG